MGWGPADWHHASGVVLGLSLLWGGFCGVSSSGSCRASRAVRAAHSQGADGHRFSRMLRAVRPRPHPSPCNSHLVVGLQEHQLHTRAPAPHPSTSRPLRSEEQAPGESSSSEPPQPLLICHRFGV